MVSLRKRIPVLGQEVQDRVRHLLLPLVDDAFQHAEQAGMTVGNVLAGLFAFGGFAFQGEENGEPV